MSFVTGWLALAGLLAIAIPILIHLLLRRRRRPVEWAAMRLLLDAVQRHRRRSRLEQILLLAVRCAILVLAGFALARPILGGAGLIGGGGRTVVLVIDDGVLSQLRDQERTAFDRSVAEARSVIEELDSGDRVAIIRAAAPARVMLEPTGDLDAASRFLERLEPAAGATDLSLALELAGSIVESSDDAANVVVLLSELRAGSLSAGAASGPIVARDERTVDLLALEAATSSVTVVQVESVDVRRPIDGSSADRSLVQVAIALHRRGGDLDAARSVVTITGGVREPAPVRTVDWEAGQSRADVEVSARLDSTLVATDGTAVVQVQVDDASLPPSAQRTVMVDGRGAIVTGIVARADFTAVGDEVEAATWIDRALAPVDDGAIETRRIDPASVDDRSLDDLDAVVVARPDLLGDVAWTALESMRGRGGFVLIVPPATLDAHPWLDRVADAFQPAWSASLQARTLAPAVRLSREQPATGLLRLLGSELAELANAVSVERRLEIDFDRTSATIALICEDGAPVVLIDDSRPDRGIVALMTVTPDLRWTDLPVKPMVVPLMQELVRRGVSEGRRAREVLAGAMATVDAPGARELLAPDESLVAVDDSLRSARPLEIPGPWRVLDAAGGSISWTAVNVDVAATDPTVTSAEDRTRALAPAGPWRNVGVDDLQAWFDAPRTSDRLAGILLALVLALVVLETALNRWFSHRQERADAKRVDGTVFAGGAA